MLLIIVRRALAATTRTFMPTTLGLIAASSGAVAQSSPDFQFRVNNTTPAAGVFLRPPTIGLVQHGAGGQPLDAMVLSWPDDTLAAVEIPLCDRMCGQFFIYDDAFGGGGRTTDTRLYLRRFDPTGVPMDAGDVVVLTAKAELHGGIVAPSVAVRPFNPGEGVADPFRLTWWDQWDWTLGPPTDPIPCQRDCDHQPVGWWQVRFGDFDAATPSAGSAAFLSPAWCHGHRPSAAYARVHDIVVWREVESPCRRILAGVDGLYIQPPLPGSIVVREQPAEGNAIDLDRPCAAWNLNHPSEFVVAWREDDLATFSSSIQARRIRADGVLGPIIEVAAPGQASPQSGPAVSMFDDGSFAVQYVGFNNGDPPQLPLMIQLFDDSDPPTAVGIPIEVVPNLAYQHLNHTVTARAPSVLTPPSARPVLASVFELPDGQGGSLDVFGRCVDPVTGLLGELTRIPLDAQQMTGGRIGEPHQHTAILRSDGLVAVAWNREVDGNNYVTVRDLPCAAPGVCCLGSTCQIVPDAGSCQPAPGFTAGAVFTTLSTECNLPGENLFPCCHADFNKSGSTTVQDIFDFLADYFASAAFCDINGSGGLSVQDIFDFLAAYFAGC